MPSRRDLPLALALLVLTGGPLPAQEPVQDPNRIAARAPGRPTLYVQAGIGLYPGEGDGVRPGIAPVWLALENRGPSLRLELEVVVQVGAQEEHRQRRRVDLPAGQSRRDWFLVPVGANSTWEVRAHEEGRQEPILRSAARPVPFDPGYQRFWGGYRPPVRALEVVDPRGDPALREPWLPAHALGTTPRRVTPGQLPDLALAWGDVDVVVLRGVDLAALSAAQSEALRLWVLGGGQLLVAAPVERRAWLADPALVRLTGPLPVELVEEAPTCLQRLYPRGPTIRTEFMRDPARLLRCTVPTRAMAFQASTTRGVSRPWPPVQRLADGRQLPLVQAIPRGLGTVHLLAFDPGVSSFAEWVDRDEFLSDLSAWVEFVGRETPRFTLQDPVPPAALVDSRRRPALWPVLLLVLVYVACVGPINGWMLRRRDAQPLLVLTVPALALLFCVLVFGLGALFRGTTLTFWRVQLLDGAQGSSVLRERSLASVLLGAAGGAQVRFAPGRTVQRLPSLHGALWRDPFTLAGAEGEPALADLELEAWTPQCFATSGLCEAGQGARVTRTARGVRLENRTPWPLAHPVAREGQQVWTGPARVEPGEAVDLVLLQATSSEQVEEALLGALAGSDPGRRQLLRRMFEAWIVGADRRGRGLLARVERSEHAIEVEGRAPALELSILCLWGEP